MKKGKKSQIISAIVAAIILLVLIILTNIDTNKGTYFQGVIQKTVKPISSVFFRLGNKKKKVGSFKDLEEFEKEYNNMQKENEELKQKINAYNIVLNENQKLSEMLNLKQKYSKFQTIPVDIIGKSPNNFSKFVTINSGSNDGIERDMIAVSEEGVYGKVVSVTATTAKVMCILDPSSKVSVNVGKDNENLIVQGNLENTNSLILTLIPVETKYSIDQPIYTSGLGGVYPKGLYIGKITKNIIPENPAEKHSIVETAIKYEKINKLLIIKNR